MGSMSCYNSTSRKKSTKTEKSQRKMVAEAEAVTVGAAIGGSSRSGRRQGGGVGWPGST
ncbi:hypothetical protein Syun_009053 [Stephania yunnanensis]|uniref:Uncharacterized protein n=1 Tax=Stephania yunnanensis TaxID=152371 RepID=A0AAP0PQ98_9MAGN